MTTESTKRARQLRERQTKAKSLLWTVLRAKQMSGMKFRRQHPVGPFIADFGCVSRRVIVELDGSHHDDRYEDDASRQRYLEQQGWTVIRFPNDDVLDNVEAVAVEFDRRKGGVSGMLIPRVRPSPGPESPTSPAKPGEVTEEAK